jgi:hypothetical protein
MRNCAVQIGGFHDEKVLLPSSERTEMRAHRNANRDRLRKTLSDNDKPAPDAFHSQGSYAMRTMVQHAENDYDIDDGVYFDKEKLVRAQGGEMSGLQARQMICDALQDRRFNKQPEVRPNCVRVYYDQGYHVDVPAYRRIAQIDPWTNTEKNKYELASTEWKQSDAREVTTWFHQQNETLSPDADGTEGAGQFCRIVRLLKAFARSRVSWKQSIGTGFMITKLVSEQFFPSEGRDDNSLRETMKRIQSRLVTNKSINHPVLNEQLTYEDDARPEFFRAKLEENLEHLNVLDEQRCLFGDAMAAWDNVFNTDWFSQQSEPDDDGPSGGRGPSGIIVGGGPSRPVDKRGGGRYARRML